jgi:hypothetical protein
MTETFGQEFMKMLVGRRYNQGIRRDGDPGWGE